MSSRHAHTYGNAEDNEDVIPKAVSTHPKYRADIDGLRAFAVLSVVAFHAFPARLAGGFIGVDVFFVISGFLISTIIFKGLDAQRFSFADFYSRRVKRIFPALALVLTSTFVVGWFVLLGEEFKQLGKHIAAGAGFISNFTLWDESGYFDAASEVKPLLHLWSLGIEEQFYMVWPLALWAAWKKKFNLLTISCLVIMASFGLNAMFIKSDSVSTFYLPHTRFWELLIGSVVAWMMLYKGETLHKAKVWLDVVLNRAIYVESKDTDGTTLNNVMSFMGCTFLGLALLLLTKESQFPGWWALLPTLGAAFIIGAGQKAWLNRLLFSNPICVWFGLISFPLYLWHWPLLSFAHILENGLPATKIRLAAIAVSIVLAWLTYSLVEKPIRFGKFGNRFKAFLLPVLMVAIGGAGYYSYRKEGIPSRLGQFEEINKAINAWQFPGDLEKSTYKNSKIYIASSQKNENTLFVGDSNVEQYYPRIDELIKKNPSNANGAIFMSGAGCPPLPNVISEGHLYCKDSMVNAVDLALERPDISTVVIIAHWKGYLLSNSYYKYVDAEGAIPVGYDTAGYHKALSGLSNQIARLKENNKKVMLMLNMPVSFDFEPQNLLDRKIENFPSLFKIKDDAIKTKDIRIMDAKINADLLSIAEKFNIKAIDPTSYICKGEYCSTRDEDGVPLYCDYCHLNPFYVRKKATFIDQAILR